MFKTKEGEWGAEIPVDRKKFDPKKEEEMKKRIAEMNRKETDVKKERTPTPSPSSSEGRKSNRTKSGYDSSSSSEGKKKKALNKRESRKRSSE